MSHLRDRIKTTIPIGVVANSRASRIPCPFHHSSDPDLQLNHGDNTFYCWGGNCPANRSGDVISWVMLRDGVDFKTALYSLAKEFGLTVELPSARTDILTRAVESFHASLFGLSGKRALDYLMNKRRLNYETLVLHKIGLCDRLPAGISLEEAQQVGLVHKHRLMPQDRITLPILNFRAQAVHLQSREYLPRDTGASKYMALPKQPSDSTDSTLYPITDWLFNERVLYKPRTDVYLFEGIPDCLTADQWGLKSVAILGKQDLHKHAYKFKDLKVLNVCMDSDEKTRSVILKELALLQAKCPQLEIRDIVLDGAKDLNEFMVNGGTRTQFLGMEAKPFVERLLEDWSTKPHLHTPLLQAVAVLRNAKDYVPLLANRCGTTETAITFAMGLLRNTSVPA